MHTRLTLAVLVAVPGLSLAGAGLFHPDGLNYDTSLRWYALHVPGLLVFPLVGVALAVLVRGRGDPVAWIVRLSAYVYATFYTALDVINGITAGYVTRQLGPGAPRPDEIRSIFDIGRPIGDIGEWGLMVCCLAIAVDQVMRHRVRGLPALVLIPAAWLVRTDHIFSPLGVLAMTLLGLTTAALVLLNPPDHEVDWARKLQGSD